MTASEKSRNLAAGATAPIKPILSEAEKASNIKWFEMDEHLSHDPDHREHIHDERIKNHMKEIETMNLRIEKLKELQGNIKSNLASDVKGTFSLRPMRGEFTKDLEAFGKMSPYVRFIYGNQIKDTKPHKSGGKEPQWNEVIEFGIDLNLNPVMTVEVWDKETLGKDDFGGRHTIDLGKFTGSETETMWFDLFTDKNQLFGKILVGLNFKYEGSSDIRKSNSDKLKLMETKVKKAQLQAELKAEEADLSRLEEQLTEEQAKLKKDAEEGAELRVKYAVDLAREHYDEMEISMDVNEMHNILYPAPPAEEEDEPVAKA